MKHYIKLVATVCLVALIVSTLGSCGYSGYHGKHEGAYTLVYSQVPDVLGARAVVAMHDPQILHLDSDSYGRGLYLYYEDCDEFLTVAIVQRETKDKVYYYPEESTLSFTIPDSMYDIDNPKLSEERLMSLLTEFCTDEMLESFKTQNDWGAPIDEGRLDSAEITSPMLPYRWSRRGDALGMGEFADAWEPAMIDVAIANGHNIDVEDPYCAYLSYVSWMATDSYGRNLYYVDGCYYIDGDADDPNLDYRCYYLEMVAITNPDGSFDPDTFMMELVDKANYQSVIRELKEINGWNQPVTEVTE